MMLIMFTMFEYYHKPENKFFNSLFYAWELIKLKFWHSVGCVALVLLIVVMTQQIFSLIFEKTLGINSGEIFLQNSEDITSTMVSAILISMVLSIFIGFIANSILFINQGIIFYSLKGEKEGINTHSTIDEIGSGE